MSRRYVNRHPDFTTWWSINQAINAQKGDPLFSCFDTSFDAVADDPIEDYGKVVKSALKEMFGVFV